jgi:microcystin-dependent protein
MKKTMVQFMALVWAAGLGVQAQSVPMLVNYQGKLQDGSGQPVPNGNYELAFKIWSDATGGTLIWGRTYPVHITDGQFNVVLGDGGGSVAGAQTTDLGVTFQAPSRFLGLTVLKDNTGTSIPTPQEIVPRQQLLSAPYALMARRAASAADADKLGNLSATNYLLKAGGNISGNVALTGNLDMKYGQGGALFVLQKPGPSSYSYNARNSALMWDSVNADISLFAWSNDNGARPNVVLQGGAVVLESTSGPTYVRGSNLRVSEGRVQDKTGEVMPVGTIVPYAGNTAPAGWLLCDGSSYNTGGYAELFDVIRYKYGGGGSSFNVPDLRGRGPLGYHPGIGAVNGLGKTGGEYSHTQTIDEMPRHNHIWNHGLERDDKGSGDSNPEYTRIGGSDASVIGERGGGQPFNVLDPYLTVNFIIKY